MSYFVILAETLHFRRTAERLHMSQPPLSRQIAALEKDFGVRLLERHSRKASLTPAGQRFLENSGAVLSSFDQADLDARLSDRANLGELSIGFMMHAVYSVLHDLAWRFMGARPEVRLALREALPSSLSGDVLRGRYDAGIMFDPGSLRGLEPRRICREPLCLALHRGHPLAQHTLIHAEDLGRASHRRTPCRNPTCETRSPAFVTLAGSSLSSGLRPSFSRPS